MSDQPFDPMHPSVDLNRAERLSRPPTALIIDEDPNIPSEAQRMAARLTVHRSNELALAMEHSPQIKALVEARESVAARLGALIEDAKSEAPTAAKDTAFKKLRIFGTVKNPELATRLALMNNKQRRAYLAGMKKAKGKKLAFKERRALQASEKAPKVERLITKSKTLSNRKDVRRKRNKRAKEKKAAEEAAFAAKRAAERARRAALKAPPEPAPVTKEGGNE